ncbi:uncharacterized protein EI97DRAFT_422757 [Westerdykella ornata]|uniref:Mg2+ transporter protein n=1 Tax=Westerdykella ornata TaxID=318751 RepID=A0A6A6JE19_WESOR|nr:uncharacterized protein EI97DRAFT_422757 [Westerdykella ornata]KAF2274248.1 hypothetical protein EI97DRAFT_422757 [Westerdykella ornata]
MRNNGPFIDNCRLAPRDLPLPEFANGLGDLFTRFEIPSAFLQESLQAASQSFGVWKKDNYTQYVWMHLLSKDVAIVAAPVPEMDTDGPAGLAQAAAASQRDRQFLHDYTWVKPGLVLKIEHDKPTSDSSKSVATLTSRPGRITLLGFGASTFQAGFQELIGTVPVDSLLEDPFILMQVAFAEMHRVIDNVGWHVADIFRGIEYDALAIATTPVKAGRLISFARLHNLMKHGIFLQENCEGAINTLDSLCSYHDEYIGKTPTSTQLRTRAELKYRRTIFRSTQGRLLALDRRMTNILQLSFNLVTQGDSRIARHEALSMRVIAFVSLWFLPLGTVATVFGTQLIRMQEDKPFRLQVSQEFWLLWVIATILTLGVVGISRMWYREVRDEEELRQGNERGWMAWKLLKTKLTIGVGNWTWSQNRRSAMASSDQHELV